MYFIFLLYRVGNLEFVQNLMGNTEVCVNIGNICSCLFFSSERKDTEVTKKG